METVAGLELWAEGHPDQDRQTDGALGRVGQTWPPVLQALVGRSRELKFFLSVMEEVNDL